MCFFYFLDEPEIFGLAKVNDFALAPTDPQSMVDWIAAYAGEEGQKKFYS